MNTADAAHPHGQDAPGGTAHGAPRGFQYVHTPFPQQVVETTAACDQHCAFCGRTYMARPKKAMARARRAPAEAMRHDPSARA